MSEIELVLRRKRASRGEALHYFLDALDSVSDECFVWPFSVDRAGYGRVPTASKTTLAHRLALYCTVGSPPADQPYAAHTCTTKGCFNPRHLRWASQLENMADKAAHGTENTGERNGGAKVTRDVVLAIRASGATNAALAREHKLSPSQVSHIRNYKRWGWLV